MKKPGDQSDERFLRELDAKAGPLPINVHELARQPLEARA